MGMIETRIGMEHNTPYHSFSCSQIIIGKVVLTMVQNNRFYTENREAQLQASRKGHPQGMGLYALIAAAQAARKEDKEVKMVI